MTKIPFEHIIILENRSFEHILTSSINIQNLLFYFNVNKNNQLSVLSSQTYTSQFNVGV